MRKPLFFFVTRVSMLVFLSLAFAGCGRNTIQSSTDPAPSPTLDPVNQVYALAWLPDGTRLASGGQDQVVHLGTPPQVSTCSPIGVTSAQVKC